MHARGPSVLVVTLIGLAIGSMIALRILIPNGMDATTFLALGENSPEQIEYASQRLGEVATREGLGHDGRFFFPQANDPWYADPSTTGGVLDRPAYRAQRMLYPLVAGGLGLFPPEVIVWSMLVINLLALAIGTLLAAKLSVAWGGTAWLGLAVPLNIGLLYEVFIGGAGVLAYAFCLAAVLARERDRRWAGGLLLAGAALTREVMLAFALGLFLLEWLQRRRFDWSIAVPPLVATSAWYVYVRVRLSGISGVGQGQDAFAPPLTGLLDALRAWVHDPTDLVINIAVLVIVILFVPLALASRLPIAWGALPFVAIALLLSTNVWLEVFDFSRALAPVFTAAAFLVALRAEKRSLVSERA
jgi:hypothetical protein